MKAPLTANSITERVQFTGLYVPEPDWHADAPGADSVPPEREGSAQADQRLET
jgi:hypothetical protein